MFRSDAAAVVLDLDPHLVPGVAAAHDDQAASRADRLGRVDEQVQEHLVELRRQALDVGQGAVLAPHVGPVLDLVGDDVQRGVDALVQRRPDPLLVGVDARELLEVLDDLAHPREAFLRLAHQHRDVLLQVVEFDSCTQCRQPDRDAAAGERRFGLLVRVEHLEHALEIGFQRAEIREDIADRIVDLVRHAGSELPDRGQSFGLQQLVLGAAKGFVQRAQFLVRALQRDEFGFGHGFQ